MCYTDCVMMMGVSMTNKHLVIITASSLFFYISWMLAVFIWRINQYEGGVPAVHNPQLVVL